MEKNAVQLRIENGVAIVRLNRPNMHNAVDDAMMAGLEASLDQIDADRSIRFVIVTGVGRESFCTGGDLRYFARLRTRREGTQMARRMQRILARLDDRRRVVVAAINGRAIGGGCEIMLAAHFRIASRQAVFSFRHAANGLSTAWGGGVRLLQLLGPSRALRLLLTAEELDAKEALRCGLVDQIVPPTKVMTAALALCTKIASNSARAVAGFLSLSEAFDRSSGRTFKELEMRFLSRTWGSPEFRGILSRYVQIPQRQDHRKERSHERSDQ